jgi:hypothetical protein
LPARTVQIECWRDINVRPAGHSTGAFATDDQHVVAAVDELLSLVLKLVPLFQPPLKGLSDTGVPAEDLRVEALWVLHPFDVGVGSLRDELGERRDQRPLVQRAGS